MSVNRTEEGLPLHLSVEPLIFLSNFLGLLLADHLEEALLRTAALGERSHGFSNSVVHHPCLFTTLTLTSYAGRAGLPPPIVAHGPIGGKGIDIGGMGGSGRARCRHLGQGDGFDRWSSLGAPLWRWLTNE